jgi:hypothetical protein
MISSGMNRCGLPSPTVRPSLGVSVVLDEQPNRALAIRAHEATRIFMAPG